MTLVLVERELRIIGRRGAFVAAMLVHAAFLILFIVAWGDGRGVTLVAHRSFYEQLRLIQWVVLAVLLPWTSARCMADECGDDLVTLAAATAVPPQQIVLGRAAATTAAMLLVTLAGLPPALLAWRMSPIPMTAVILDEAMLGGAAFLTVAVTLALRLEIQRGASDRRVPAWGVSTGVVAAILMAVWSTTPLTAIAVATLVGGGTAGALMAVRRAQGRFVYLAERQL